MNVVPSGWLAANGAAVSRTLYPALFAAIGTLYGAGNGSTTFALPDLRGYFVRGTGKNTDNTESGTFGQNQADAFKSHAHSTSGELPTNNGSAGYKLPGSKVRVQSGVGNSEVFSAVLDGAVIYHGHTISSEGGTETRPKNIALLYCIKF
jgi:microcystin-dependent protein